MAEGTRTLIQGPEGKLLQAEDLGFKQVSEGWSVYEVADGTTLRVKVVAQKISRALDETGSLYHKGDGEPLYNLRYQVMVSAEVQKDLLKAPQ
ncbi:MAG: hypothetical protein PHU43_00130 [Candidatus Bipolaricaulis sp.]|nr:hypothetical protein [Candidatus Bipolaricaulis sp.]